MFLRAAWLVLRKDLTVEVRSLEIALTTLFFAVSAVLVFAFALVQEGRAPEDGAAGILWIAIAFAGTLALLRQRPGSELDVGLVESLDSLLASLRHGLTTPGGALGGGVPRYGVYRAKTGRVAVAALEPHFEARLYQELDLPAQADPSSRFLERTATEWEAWARERDLPIVAVRDLDSATATGR